ncbi:ABC transporter permease [Gordonia sp. ABSL1-1]|uniref:ABC transporter permease n=1 Tax=Gordonia sp. ABSL1-1 TaxID=3053923 RepID=UPI0025722CAA|nr:ABC transporter permease [Gordonia sp. ABSL1-1]MDL9938030.1 ABC transporter permease [Gordonia sp. ABSL1-1]
MTTSPVLPRTSDRFAGTAMMLRLMLRREWLTITITLAVFLLLNVSTAASINSMYPGAAERQAARAGLGANSAFRFLLGPLDHTDSAASMTVWRAGLFMVAALGVCVVLQVVRQTRKEEELGRAELVRSGVVGPLAPLSAAAIAASVFSIVVALAMSLMLFPLGAEAADVAAVFAQYASTGMAAAGAALVTAQVAKTSHIANMTAASVVLVGYLLRGVADSTGGWGWLRWLTPMGWAQLIDPFGDNNLWFALTSVVVFAAGWSLAAAVTNRRDLGGGLIAPRPGPADARHMGSIEVIVARLSAPLLGSWVGGVIVYGLVVGFMQPSVSQLAEGNSKFDEIIRQTTTPADLETLFGMTMMTFFAIAAGAWTVNLTTRMHGEEHAARTEVLLATPASRSRFLFAYIEMAMLGVVAILASAVVSIIVGNALAGGDAGRAGADLVQAALAQLPAALVVSSLVLALYGIRSRLVMLGWFIVLVALFLGPMSGMFDLPQWVKDLSPYTHTPLVPVEPMRWLPVVVMACLAAALVALAQAVFARRDVG